MKQDTQVSPLAKDSKSKPKGKPETGPSTASLKALQKEVTACLMLVCDTLLPLSVTDPVYAKLVRTQSMILNVQDQLTALVGALPTLPPVDAGSMVIPAEARATVTEVKCPGDGHCCFHALAAAKQDLAAPRRRDLPTFSVALAKEERAAVADLYKRKKCPEVTLEFQEPTAQAMAMDKLIRGVQASQKGGAQEIRARAVDLGFCARIENLGTTAHSSAYILVGDLSSDNMVLFFRYPSPGHYNVPRSTTDR